MYSYNPYYANYLMHYGTPQHSGRYPWGSGERPYQHGGGPKAKRKFARRTNLFTASAAIKKVKSDYKEGKISKEDKVSLVKGINKEFQEERKNIRKNDLRMTKDEYYKNTTGEFRNTQSFSRILFAGTMHGGIIPAFILDSKASQYNRLPDNIQKNVATYINNAKKISIAQITAEIEKMKAKISA